MLIDFANNGTKKFCAKFKKMAKSLNFPEKSQRLISNNHISGLMPVTPNFCRKFMLRRSQDYIFFLIFRFFFEIQISEEKWSLAQN